MSSITPPSGRRDEVAASPSPRLPRRATLQAPHPLRLDASDIEIVARQVEFRAADGAGDKDAAWVSRVWLESIRWVVGRCLHGVPFSGRFLAAHRSTVALRQTRPDASSLTGFGKPLTFVSWSARCLLTPSRAAISVTPTSSI